VLGVGPLLVIQRAGDGDKLVDVCSPSGYQRGNGATA
jgi:hypothetical protein